MGKASRKKRQKESQAESISKDKPLEAEETSAKWSLFNKPLLHLLLITIIGFLIYSNTFNVPFHFDDTPNIVENYKIKDLSNSWPPSGSRWFGFLTFALNYKLGGLNTTGYHIVNIVIHIFNAILVYWLVMLTFRTPYFKVSVISASVSNQPNQFNLSTFKPLNYLPLFIALLFVSHPIQTQAVTYIVQRFTSLAAFFYLLSLVMYIKARLGQTTEAEVKAKVKFFSASTLTFYFLSVLSAILAMKTKEISFTLPFIIILYEFCFFKSQNYELRTMNLRRLLYLMPFLLTLFIIPLSLISIDKPVGDAIGELREAAQETEEIPRWSYLFTQFRVIVTYIRLLFLPIKQNLDYDYPIYNSFLNPNVFLSFLFLLLLFATAIYLLYRSRFRTQNSEGLNFQPATFNLKLISFGIFWFFITLSVESSIIPIRDVIFEHRVYLPSVGAVIAFSTAVFRVFHRATEQQSNRAVVKGKTAVLLHYCSAALIVIALSVATYQRNTIWKDEVSLWENVVEKSPYKARGYNNLGCLGYSKRKLVDKAIQVYQTALRLKPDFAYAHINLGIAYKTKELIDKAIEHYQIALQLWPNFAEAHYNLSNAYIAKGLTDKAIEHYQIALNLKPDYSEAYNNLGNIYRDKGLIDKAIEHYHIALNLKPDFAEAHNNIGNAYSDKGLIDEAIEHYQIALNLKPDFAHAHNNIGIAYGKKGLLDKALKEFQTAIRLKPDFTDAHINIGTAYEKKGLIEAAAKQYELALRLDPKHEIAKDNLNRILQIKKK